MRQFILLGILVLALTPVTSECQVRLIIVGGLSQPNGDFTNQVNTGLHGRAGLQVGVPVFPVSLRGEGEIHQFSKPTGAENTTMLDGTLSAVLGLGGIGLQPYLLAGIGSYRLDPGGTEEAKTNRGFHGGFGVGIGALGFGGFAEIRLVNISGDTGNIRYIPVTLGLRF